jgi:hypothetical protein
VAGEQNSCRPVLLSRHVRHDRVENRDDVPVVADE